MDERLVQFRIGLMVLAAFLVTGILMLWFGGKKTLFQPTYVIRVDFDEAPGVTRDTPVRKSGVLIGRVTDVRLLDQGGVTVTAEIDGHRKLFSDEECYINRSLLGDSVLEFVRKRGEPQPPGENARPLRTDRPDDDRVQLDGGTRLQGKVVKDPYQVVGNLEGDLSEAIGSVADTSNDLRRLIRTLDELLTTNETRINGILEDTAGTMRSVKKAVENYEDLAGDPELKAKLRAALEELPQIVDEARQAVGDVKLAVAAANDSLQNVKGFSQSLQTDGTQIMTRLDNGAADLETVMREMVEVSQAVNSREGTLGKLVHDPELYDRVNRTVTDVEELTVQLKPILRDARVFSDKIARHPELLGVRGALQRSPGIKGVPRF